MNINFIGRRAKKARQIFADLGNYNNDECFDTKVSHPINSTMCAQEVN